jgi:flagellar secretion chaperone FliS
MYASPFQSPSAARGHLGVLYRNVGIETGTQGASPHRLVAMLFEGFMESIARAKGAMRDGLIEVKGQSISRAVRIIEEGLRASLDRQAGGALSADLDDLYNYVSMRLTLANVRNSVEMLDECQRLMLPLQEAWESIGPKVAGMAASTGTGNSGSNGA